MTALRTVKVIAFQFGGDIHACHVLRRHVQDVLTRRVDAESFSEGYGVPAHILIDVRTDECERLKQYFDVEEVTA